MEPILVVGMGPGSTALLTDEARDAVRAARIVFGAPRHLDTVRAGLCSDEQELYELSGNLSSALDQIDVARRRAQTAVLVSGDPGIYSYAAALRRRFDRSELALIPGISSVQLACARASLPWQDALVMSGHGRRLDDLAGSLEARRTLVILTDRTTTASEVARRVASAGYGRRWLWVCEDLSYEHERVRRMTAAEAQSVETTDLCVVVIEESDE